MADDMFSDAAMTRAAEDAERAGYDLYARRYRAVLRVPVEVRGGLFRMAAQAATPSRVFGAWVPSSQAADPVEYTVQVEAVVERWLAEHLGVAS
mgnify:FL=1